MLTETLIPSGQDAGCAGAGQNPRAKFLHEADLFDDRDEFGGRHGASPRMTPSRQRLKTPDSAGRDIDDRLEINVDCVVDDCCPELKLDQPADLDFSIHRLLEGPPPAPAVRFRRV